MYVTGSILSTMAILFFLVLSIYIIKVPLEVFQEKRIPKSENVRIIAKTVIRTASLLFFINIMIYDAIPLLYDACEFLAGEKPIVKSGVIVSSHFLSRKWGSFPAVLLNGKDSFDIPFSSDDFNKGDGITIKYLRRSHHVIGYTFNDLTTLRLFRAEISQKKRYIKKKS